MFSGVLKKNIIDIKYQQICNLLLLNKFSINGGKIYIAIDSSEVYKYVMPYIGEFRDGEHRLWWFQEQMTLNYLFDDFPKTGRKLWFFAPHYQEIMDIKKYRLRSLIGNKLMLESNDFERLISKYIEDEKHIYDRIKKEVDTFDSINKDDFLDSSLKLLEDSYIPIYTILTVGSRNSISKIDEIETNPYTGIVKSKLDEFGRFVTSRSQIEKLADEWLEKIIKSRPNMGILNNYRDALVYAQLSQINDKINKEKSILILVSRTGFGSYVEPWPNFPEGHIEINEKDNEFAVIPLVVHPVIFYVHIISRVLDQKGRLNSLKTVKVLANSLWRLREIIDGGEVLFDEGENEYSKEAENIIKHLMINDIPKSENISAALTMVRPENKEKIDAIINKIYSKRNTIMETIVQRFESLLDLILSDNKFTAKAAEARKKLHQHIDNEIENVIDLATFGKVFQRWQFYNPFRYNINLDDFEEEGIRESYIKIMEGKDIKYQLDTIYMHNKQRRAGKIDRKSANILWEAALLTAIIKTKCRYEKWAIEDCIDGEKNALPRLVPLFSFVKNIAMARIESELPIAIENAREISAKYGKQSPRYKLQLAYLLWKGNMRNLPNCDLKDVENIMDDVIVIARKKRQKALTCYRLALVDSAIIKADLAKYNTAKKYLNELENTEINGNNILLLDFTKAYISVKENADLLKNINSKVNLQDSDNSIIIMKNSIAGLKSTIKKTEGLSAFVRKLCEKIIKEANYLIDENCKKRRC